MRSSPNYYRGESKRNSMRRLGMRGETQQHGSRSVSCKESPNHSARRSGGVGGCRQLAQITIGDRRQPATEFAPRNNTIRQAQKFFPPQITVRGGKYFGGSKKSFPL